MSPEQHARTVEGRYRRRAVRVAELEHLIAGGIPAHEAAVRAGWPTASAAARTLYRIGHPLATAVQHADWLTRKRAA